MDRRECGCGVGDRRSGRARLARGNVILDGVLDLEAEVWLNNVLADDVGWRVYDELCVESPECRAALGEAPAARLEDVLESFRSGSADRCPAFADVDRAELAEVHGRLLGDGGRAPEAAALATGLTLRLHRCSDSDRAQLRHFLGQWRQVASRSTVDVDYSAELFFNVLRHDMLGHVESWPRRELAAYADELAFFGDHEIHRFRRVFDAWPKIAELPADQQLQALTSTPILILSGGQDYRTVRPWAQRVARHFNGPHQREVYVPIGGHGLAIGALPTAAGQVCVNGIVAEFLAQPQAQLDLECIEDVGLPDFAGQLDPTKASSMAWFGTEDIYDSGSNAPGAVADSRRRGLARTGYWIGHGSMRSRTMPGNMRSK